MAPTSAQVPRVTRPWEVTSMPTITSATTSVATTITGDQQIENAGQAHTSAAWAAA